MLAFCWNTVLFWNKTEKKTWQSAELIVCSENRTEEFLFVKQAASTKMAIFEFYNFVDFNQVNFQCFEVINNNIQSKLRHNWTSFWFSAILYVGTVVLPQSKW